MLKKLNVNNILLLVTIFFLCKNVYSQNVTINKTILIDATIRHLKTDNEPRGYLRTPNHVDQINFIKTDSNRYRENTILIQINGGDLIFFENLKKVSLENIEQPYEILNFYEFLLFSDKEFKKKHPDKHHLLFYRTYLMDFKVTNLFIKVLNNNTNEIEYYKADLGYSSIAR